MTTSLAFCANNGISLLDDPVNEQTVTQVTHVYRGHQPTYLRAQQISGDGCLADFLMRNNGLIPG